MLKPAFLPNLEVFQQCIYDLEGEESIVIIKKEEKKESA